MSVPVKPAEKSLITVSFTALLYGVVIDATLHRLHSLEPTITHVLILVALAIVVQDFFFYHEDMKMINDVFAKEAKAAATPAERRVMEAERRRKERNVFICDLLVLGAWFTLSLAASAPLRTYLLCLAIFFVSVGIWERVAPNAPRDILHTHVPVALVACGAALVGAFFLDGAGTDGHLPVTSWSRLEVMLLAVPLATFTLWRYYYWKNLQEEIQKDLHAAYPDEEPAVAVAPAGGGAD